MKIIPKNNTFENTQITSFLNKLDALIASGYADADDYTHTAGGNSRPTPTSADFTENKLNKTLLIEFIEVLLKATPPEHKNAVEYALTALRYTNKYKLTIPCLLDAFVCGLVKLNVPKNIIKLTTPILCEVLPDTTPELVERKLNEENNGFELEFFSQYLAENYDNFAGKFVDNSWLAELNKANRLKFEPCEVSEMPPAEPEISQAELATGTDGDLPTQIQPTKITIAEADATATAKQNYSFKLKGDAQNFAKERNMSNENFTTNSNLTTNNNNTENDTNVATDATNSQLSNAQINESENLPANFPLPTYQDGDLIFKFNSIANESEKCKFFYDHFCDNNINLIENSKYFQNNKLLYNVNDNSKIIKLTDAKKILQENFVFNNGIRNIKLTGEHLLVNLYKNFKNENKIIFTDENGNVYSFGNAKNCFCKLKSCEITNYIFAFDNLATANIVCSSFNIIDEYCEVILITEPFNTLSNLQENVGEQCSIYTFISRNQAELYGKYIPKIKFIFDNVLEKYLSYFNDNSDYKTSAKEILWREDSDFKKYFFDIIKAADVDYENNPQIEENCESLKRWNDDDLAFNEPFPLKDFPEIIQNIVKARPRTPQPLTALTSITIFAAAIQGHYNLLAFYDGDFAILPTNISTFILAPSSAGKSSTLKLLTESIDRAQEFWKNERIRKLAEAEQTKTALAKEKNKKEPNEHTISVLENNLNEIEAETPPQNIFHFDGTATSEAIKDLAEVNKNLLFSNAEAANIFNSKNASETQKFLSDRSQIHDGFLPSHYTKTNGSNESTNVRASQVYMTQPETFKSLGDHFAILAAKQGTLVRALFYCCYIFDKPTLNPDILPSKKQIENKNIKLFNDIIYKLLTSYKIKVNDKNILLPEYELTFSNDCYKFYCEKDKEIIKSNKKKNSVEAAVFGKVLENAQRLAPTFHLIDLIMKDLQSELGKKYGVAGGFNLERYSKIPISLDCLKRAYNVAEYSAKSLEFYFGGGNNYEQDNDDYKLKIEVVKKLFNRREFKEKMQTTSAMLATAIRTGSKKTFKNIKKADIDRIMPYLQLKGVFLSTDTQTINSRGYVYSINPALYEFPSFDAYANEMQLFK